MHLQTTTYKNESITRDSIFGIGLHFKELNSVPL